MTNANLIQAWCNLDSSVLETTIMQISVRACHSAALGNQNKPTSHRCDDTVDLELGIPLHTPLARANLASARPTSRFLLPLGQWTRSSPNPFTTISPRINISIC